MQQTKIFEILRANEFDLATNVLRAINLCVNSIVIQFARLSLIAEKKFLLYEGLGEQIIRVLYKVT